MAFRKLTKEEKEYRDQLDKDRDKFMFGLELLGWVLLIGFCVFFAKMCGYIPDLA